MVSITQLEYILSVYTEGHFGRAAKRSHISQPTLSMQIRKLEEHFNITIFDREKQPVRATADGEVFIAQARRVLQEYRQLTVLVEEQRGDISGPFSLAIIPTVAPYLLPLFLKQFAEQLPKVALTVEEMQTEQIIAALNNETIDAAILATPLHISGVHEEPLYYEPFFVCVPTTHPLAKRKQVSESDLNPEGILLLDEGHCLRNQVTQICNFKNAATQQQNAHLRFAGGNLETLKRLVARGIGYTLMPSLAIDDSFAEDIHMLRFKGAQPTREISLVFRRAQHKRPVLTKLRQCIAEQVPKSLRNKPDAKQIIGPQTQSAPNF